jgi:hypothetical protein
MKIEIVNSDQIKNRSMGSLKINRKAISIRNIKNRSIGSPKINRKAISMRNKDIGTKSQENKKITNNSKITKKNLKRRNQTNKKNMIIFSKPNRSPL